MSKLVNQYLSNLAVFNIKLHNLHWNIVGIHFKSIHEYTEHLYDEAFKSFDDVAELLRMRGLRPAASLKEYLELSTLQELPSTEDFSTNQTLSIVIEDLKALRALALDVRAEAEESDDFGIANFFEDQVEFIDKELWFLNSMKQA